MHSSSSSGIGCSLGAIASWVSGDVELSLLNSIRTVKTMVVLRDGLKVFCVVIDMSLLGPKGRIITCEMPL